MAGIVLAAASVISLVWAVWTYCRNADAQVQLLALGTLQHYLDLSVAHPDLASCDNEQPIDPRYSWFAAQALVTAQTLGHWLDAGRTGSGPSMASLASIGRLCGVNVKIR